MFIRLTVCYVTKTLTYKLKIFEDKHSGAVTTFLNLPEYKLLRGVSLEFYT